MVQPTFLLLGLNMNFSESSVTSSSSSSALKFWSESDDSILRGAVAQQDQDNINWHEVAAQLPNRTNKECRKRWVYSLFPAINKGPWNEEENRLLQEGVRVHGTR